MKIHALKDWRDSALRSIDREIDCLEEKLKRLYDHKRLLEAVDKLTDVMEGGPVRNVKYLELLSQEFTKEEFASLRVANHQSADVRYVIHRWVKEGKILKIGRNVWRKCE